MTEVQDARTVVTEPSPSLHIVMFYHSVVSDWNNGNAHFLRGLVRSLTCLGHHVVVYEPRNGWSIENLQAEQINANIEEDFSRTFPEINYVRYNPEHLQLDEVLETADVVIVHEWNDHDLVKAIGDHRASSQNYTLLFHDTHHRAVSDPTALRAYDLSNFDGVLAFGNVIRDIYIAKGWAQQAWTFHEAADTHLFYPRQSKDPKGDLLWIGNWGDEERTEELHQYLFDPVREMRLRCCVYGVRYPETAIEELTRSGISYCGRLPNSLVPEVAATYKAMVHVPRRPYVETLPGIPTIRPFEAMACGIPLVSAYWRDEENLFTVGKDYLLAHNPAEMRSHIKLVLEDADVRHELINNGLRTIREKHTCSHRAQQLLRILEELDSPAARKMGRVCTNQQ